MLDIPAAERIIVAMDCSEERALQLADILKGHASWVKVGMTLYYAAGPRIVKEFKDRGFHVFTDLKLHDIPHQVGRAAASIVNAGAEMFTVHAMGGSDMMHAAVIAAQAAASPEDPDPKILAVTVLTSIDEPTLKKLGVERGIADQVSSLALMSKEAGCTGIVCSPREARSMRAALGPEACIVTPGVRPKGASLDDQKRVATPQDALDAGASYLVIGRPITGAEDPAGAFDAIVESIG